MDRSSIFSYESYGSRCSSSAGGGNSPRPSWYSNELPGEIDDVGPSFFFVPAVGHRLILPVSLLQATMRLEGQEEDLTMPDSEKTPSLHPAPHSVWAQADNLAAVSRLCCLFEHTMADPQCGHRNKPRPRAWSACRVRSKVPIRRRRRVSNCRRRFLRIWRAQRARLDPRLLLLEAGPLAIRRAQLRRLLWSLPTSISTVPSDLYISSCPLHMSATP